jgi:pimeloyl-ACP methyl ester carboxylesterase
MGSLISLRMALKYPSRVDGIVAMSSISRAATKEVIEVFTQFYNGWVSTTTPSEELMNLAIVGWGGDNVNVNSDRAKIIKRDWTERYSGIVNVEGIAESLNTRDDIVDELTHVKCPVSLIHGEMDTTWGVEEAEIELEKLRDGELKIVKGEGHMLIFIREAEDVNGWIEEFLKKLGY